jgi:cytochrome d ubiquinol oxidase subunit I
LAGIALPFLANFAGWILTETARQPWIVYGLQRTAAGVSTTSSTAMVGASLAVFVGLYGVLAIVDFWLMRRYARVDPPEIDDAPSGGAPRPAPQY